MVERINLCTCCQLTSRQVELTVNGDDSIVLGRFDKIVNGRFSTKGHEGFALLRWSNVVNGFEVVLYSKLDTGMSAAGLKFIKISSAVLCSDVSPETTWRGDIAVGDINSDGIDEVVIADFMGGRLLVWFTERNQITELVPIRYGHPYYVAIGNFSGCNRKDIALLCKFDGKTKFCFIFSDSRGRYLPPMSTPDEGVDSQVGYQCVQLINQHFTSILNAVSVNDSTRDAVSVNGLLRWWDNGLKGRFGTTKPQHAQHYEVGSHFAYSNREASPIVCRHDSQQPRVDCGMSLNCRR